MQRLTQRMRYPVHKPRTTSGVYKTGENLLIRLVEAGKHVDGIAKSRPVTNMCHACIEAGCPSQHLFKLSLAGFVKHLVHFGKFVDSVANLQIV